MIPVRLEPATPRSRVKHSTTEPLRSYYIMFCQSLHNALKPPSTGDKKWDNLLFPTFLICSYFSLLFIENTLLSLLFHSKVSLTRKNPEFFPRSLRSLNFRNQSYFFSGSPPLKHNKKLFFTKKVSLFSQYYYHSSCPAYLVLNFVYLINDCDDFCTWKSPTIPTFLHR